VFFIAVILNSATFHKSGIGSADQINQMAPKKAAEP